MPRGQRDSIVDDDPYKFLFLEQILNKLEYTLIQSHFTVLLVSYSSKNSIREDNEEPLLDNFHRFNTWTNYLNKAFGGFDGEKKSFQ